jgi:hypothetical protein
VSGDKYRIGQIANYLGGERAEVLTLGRCDACITAKGGQRSRRMTRWAAANESNSMRHAILMKQ